MFTGIVEEMGRVQEAAPGRLTIEAKKVLDGLRIGDSVAVNGACLTVVRQEGAGFSVDVTPETARRTNLGLLGQDDPVNLERAVALGERLGGHLVQGHVEGVGRVLSLAPEGDAVVMSIEAPPEIMRYVVSKGFIAVDGISLTAVECDASSFTVSVIPYTRKQTILGLRRPGDAVNLETDIVARYVERLVKGEA